METTINSLEETKEFAQKIAKNLKLGDVVALYGDLGAGKTTFTRFLVEALGISARVQSPTFVVARRYEDKVHHLDLYRLTNKEEVLDMGFEEFVNDKTAITIIEWPEIIEELLPQNTIKIKFENPDKDETRKIYVQNLH